MNPFAAKQPSTASQDRRRMSLRRTKLPKSEDILALETFFDSLDFSEEPLDLTPPENVLNFLVKGLNYKILLQYIIRGLDGSFDGEAEVLNQNRSLAVSKMLSDHEMSEEVSNWIEDNLQDFVSELLKCIENATKANIVHFAEAFKGLSVYCDFPQVILDVLNKRGKSLVLRMLMCTNCKSITDIWITILFNIFETGEELHIMEEIHAFLCDTVNLTSMLIGQATETDDFLLRRTLLDLFMLIVSRLVTLRNCDNQALVAAVKKSKLLDGLKENKEDMEKLHKIFTAYNSEKQWGDFMNLLGTLCPWLSEQNGTAAIHKSKNQQDILELEKFLDSIDFSNQNVHVKPSSKLLAFIRKDINYKLLLKYIVRPVEEEAEGEENNVELELLKQKRSYTVMYFLYDNNMSEEVADFIEDSLQNMTIELLRCVDRTKSKSNLFHFAEAMTGLSVFYAFPQVFLGVLKSRGLSLLRKMLLCTKYCSAVSDLLIKILFTLFDSGEELHLMEELHCLLATGDTNLLSLIVHMMCNPNYKGSAETLPDSDAQQNSGLLLCESLQDLFTAILSKISWGSYKANLFEGLNQDNARDVVTTLLQTILDSKNYTTQRCCAETAFQLLRFREAIIFQKDSSNQVKVRFAQVYDQLREAFTQNIQMVVNYLKRPKDKIQSLDVCMMHIFKIILTDELFLDYPRIADNDMWKNLTFHFFNSKYFCLYHNVFSNVLIHLIQKIDTCENLLDKIFFEHQFLDKVVAEINNPKSEIKSHIVKIFSELDQLDESDNMIITILDKVKNWPEFQFQARELLNLENVRPLLPKKSFGPGMPPGTPRASEANNSAEFFN